MSVRLLPLHPWSDFLQSSIVLIKFKFDLQISINHTGKMLGGSGTHNEMVHSRGSPKDFDNWAAITGDESWSYENVLQYFKKSETFIAEQYGSENLEGKGGGCECPPLEVNHFP